MKPRPAFRVRDRAKVAADQPAARPSAQALTKRLVTAGVLAPLLIGAIVYAEIWPLATLLAMFLAAAAWEWTALAGLTGRLMRISYAAGLLLAALWLDHVATTDTLRSLIALLAVGVWAGATLLLASVERGWVPGKWPVAANLLIGGLILLPFWLAVLWLKALDYRLLLGLAALIWLADSLAYFAGRRWGRHRLAPRVSPGKTWEGVLAGLAAALPVAAVLASSCWDGSPSSIGLLTLLGIATIGISVVGDLFESFFKRQAGVKDSGRLLPGHGGVLDRLDSLTAAAPMFYLGVILLGARA